jgi:hypothetical protein
VKVQTLKTKNRALKFSYISTNIISTDLDKYVGQRLSNKSGLEYKKLSMTFMCLKNKEKQVQWSNTQIMKSNNVKSFKKNHNYAF